MMMAGRRMHFAEELRALIDSDICSDIEALILSRRYRRAGCRCRFHRRAYYVNAIILPA